MIQYRFEPGKVYLEHRKVILEKYTVRYRCERRTDKTVWLTRLENDGREIGPHRYKIREGLDSEYAYGAGPGNARSVWYSSSLNLFARDVE